MAKKGRKADYIASTIRLYAVHDPDQNARITEACTRQRAVHNTAIAHLLKHCSDEPLQRNAEKSVTGLYGRWADT